MSNENNLWFKRTPSHVTSVFVHGILSNSSVCWRAKKNLGGAYWPDILSSDRRLARVDIFLGGYQTALDSGEYDIDQCTTELLTALRSMDDSGNPAPIDSPCIVFICHSLGGVVVRHLLTTYEAIFRDKVVGVALVASPSLGSDYADLAKGLSKLYGHRIAKALRRGSAELQALDTQFRRLVDEKRNRMPCLEGAEAYEHFGMIHFKFLPLSRVFPPIVKKDALGKYFGAPRLIARTNHVTIAKPTSKDHPSHQFLVDFLQHKVFPRMSDCLKLQEYEQFELDIPRDTLERIVEVKISIKIKTSALGELPKHLLELEQRLNGELHDSSNQS